MKQRAIQALGKVKPDSWEYRKTLPDRVKPTRDGLYMDCCDVPSANPGNYKSHEKGCPSAGLGLRLTRAVYPFEIRPGDLIEYWGGGGVNFFWVTTKYPYVWDCTARDPRARDAPPDLFLQFLNDNGEYSHALPVGKQIDLCIASPFHGSPGGETDPIPEFRKLHPKTRRWEKLVLDAATGLYDFEEEQL